MSLIAGVWVGLHHHPRVAGVEVDAEWNRSHLSSGVHDVHFFLSVRPRSTHLDVWVITRVAKSTRTVWHRHVHRRGWIKYTHLANHFFSSLLKVSLGVDARADGRLLDVPTTVHAAQRGTD